MHIRPAEPSDEPAIAALATRAFSKEDLFCRVILPYQNEYPEDAQIYWHEWVRTGWANPRTKIVVAVTEDDQRQEKVIGVAIWQRQGDDPAAQKVISTWADPGTFPTLPTENRALDASKKNILAEAAPYTKHHWAGPRANNWYLDVCCVDPAAHGLGAGRRLVRWGLDRAEEEGVAASVMASDGKDGFYLKCGFDEIVGNASEGEGNPLRKENVRGGSIIFMWPKDQKTIDGETL